MPFGLIRVDGSEKPSYRAFQRAAVNAIDTGWPLSTSSPPPEPPATPDRKQRLYDLIDALRAEVAAL